MKYPAALLFSGLAWFVVSCVFLRELAQKPVAHLMCAVITSFAVGYLFRSKIMRSLGWRFYLGWPLAILTSALTIYGLLVPASWFLIGRADGFGVDGEAFINMPTIFLMSGLTFFLPLLLPLTIGTNVLLRKILRSEERA